MNSINVFKGYDKVNPEQQQQQHHLELQSQIQYQKSTRPKSPIISTIIISATFGLTFVLGLMLISLITTTTTESSSVSVSSPPLSNSAESTIRTICNMTRYPDTCFNSISSLNTSPKPDPQTILKLSLNVSISQLTNMSSFLTSLDSDAAVRDCREQVEEALSRLRDSVETIKKVEALSEDDKVVKDIQTWVSSAVTDQETCLDGLEEMGSVGVEQVKLKMQRSMEFTSNSLAIVANWKAILDKFNR